MRPRILRFRALEMTMNTLHLGTITALLYFSVLVSFIAIVATY
jgi:hypothetical protein